MPDPAASPIADSPATPWTRREIAQQPATLGATQALLDARRAEIEAFLTPLLTRPNLRIILAGAGTSAFIGECLAPWLESRLGRRVDAIATTDIVSVPHLYLRPDMPTLLVSFGRSGNSPESIAAAEQVDAQVRDAHHLVITCNGEGALARRAVTSGLVLLLPEATHDRGFAMTSSFTAMMLAALSALGGVAAMNGRIAAIAGSVATMLASAQAMAARLAADPFERVVYLGSGVFKGLAREAALKLMELTDGQLVTAFDSPMGFRHGPKTIVNDKTLVIIFVSNDPATRPYDVDLIDELRRDGQAGAVIEVSADGGGADAIGVGAADDGPDIELLFPYIVPAQLYALERSIRLGLTPDTPNPTGTVNRVVQGVRLHIGPA